jgi:hypothetical protein
MGDDLLDNIRTKCREVAERSEFVRIDHERITAYAASLPASQLKAPQMDPSRHYLGHDEGTVAFFLTLDAINFGSGYFPELLKNPGASGYFSVVSALNDHFDTFGPLSARDLTGLTASDCARIFSQDIDNPSARELMGLFARSLSELGNFLSARFDGNFLGLVQAAGNSAAALVTLLREMPDFNDAAEYRGVNVPFFKRAQLAAADLCIAFAGQGPGYFKDIDRLTIMADNLVPHVLRLDGVLHYREDLAARIERGERLLCGSEEEVEIRACAVHAAELILAALHREGRGINAMLLDNFLWHRGQEGSYRVRPRHRTRTVFY